MLTKDVRTSSADLSADRQTSQTCLPVGRFTQKSSA